MASLTLQFGSIIFHYFSFFHFYFSRSWANQGSMRGLLLVPGACRGARGTFQSPRSPLKSTVTELGENGVGAAAWGREEGADVGSQDMCRYMVLVNTSRWAKEELAAGMECTQFLVHRTD